MPPPHDATLFDSKQGGAKTNLPSDGAYSKLVEPEAFADARNMATGVKNTQDIPTSSTTVNALKYVYTDSRRNGVLNIGAQESGRA